MKRIFRLVCIMIALIAVQNVCAGMSVEINPREPRKNEEFSLDIYFTGVANAMKGEIGFDSKGIQIISRKWNEKTSSDFFGRRKKQIAYSFRLKAKKSGRLSIGTFKWIINGQTINIDSNIKINVKRSYKAPGVKISPVLSKRSVYVGEQFRYSIDISLYDNYQGNLSFSKENFGTDFWSYKNKEMKPEKRRAQPPFVDRMFLKYAYLSSTKAGDISVPTVEMNYTKEGPVVREEKKQQNGKSSFFFSSSRSKPIDAQAKTPEVKIKVKALPSKGKPERFSGLVGQYTLSAKFDKTTIDMGDAITLTLKMSGNGRPGNIPNPKLPDFSAFRTVPPESKTSKKEVGGIIKTFKTVKYFLYPKRSGSFKLEPITYNYFDPKAAQYKTLSSGPITIVVNKGSANQYVSGNQQVLVHSQDRIRSLGTDIRFIKKEASLLNDDGNYFHNQLWYWILLLSSSTPLVVTIFIRKYRSNIGASTQKKRKGKARSQALKRLKDARTALTKGDNREFYVELSNAVSKFLSDKLAKEFIGLTLDGAIAELHSQKVSNELITQFKELMTECDMAQFSSLQTGSAEMERGFTKAEELLKALEKAL